MKRTSALFLLFCSISCFAQKSELFKQYIRSINAEAHILWIDGSANINWLIHPEEVKIFCQNASHAGFNELVLDVKLISGQTLYPSSVAQTLTTWKGVIVPSHYDILQTVLTYAHQEGLKVSVSINVLSEGHKGFQGIGLAYEHTDWQMSSNITSRYLSAKGQLFPLLRVNVVPESNSASVFTPGNVITDNSSSSLFLTINSDGLVIGKSRGNIVPKGIEVPIGGWLVWAKGIEAQQLDSLNLTDNSTFVGKSAIVPIIQGDSEGGALFVNPLNPEVRAHEKAVVQELLQNYDVDAIVFDRMRYAGIDTDFSELSRKTFEDKYGRTGIWPDEVLTMDPVPGKTIKRGRMFPQWMEFRANVIQEFLNELVETAHKAKPDIPIGIYVGSWYDSYYEVGVNWASDSTNPPYDWASKAYKYTGYADKIDFLMTGCYYKIPFLEDAPLYDAEEGATVESAGKRSNLLAGSGVFVYASIYLHDYEADAKGVERSVRAALKSSCGVMVFDASYLRDNALWNAFHTVFQDKKVTSPHNYPSLLKSLRKLRDYKSK